MIDEPCGYTSAHLFHQRLGNCQSQPVGISGCFHGEETIKQLSNLNLIQSGSGVGKNNLPIITEGDFQITVAVFQSIVQNVAEHPGQSLSVERFLDALAAMFEVDGTVDDGRSLSKEAQ